MFHSRISVENCWRFSWVWILTHSELSVVISSLALTTKCRSGMSVQIVSRVLTARIADNRDIIHREGENLRIVHFFLSVEHQGELSMTTSLVRWTRHHRSSGSYVVFIGNGEKWHFMIMPSIFVVLCSDGGYRLTLRMIGRGMHAKSHRGVSTLIGEIVVESKALFSTVRSSVDYSSESINTEITWLICCFLISVLTYSPEKRWRTREERVPETDLARMFDRQTPLDRHSHSSTSDIDRSTYQSHWIDREIRIVLHPTSRKLTWRHPKHYAPDQFSIYLQTDVASDRGWSIFSSLICLPSVVWRLAPVHGRRDWNRQSSNKPSLNVQLKSTAAWLALITRDRSRPSKFNGMTGLGGPWMFIFGWE